jgi:hypothetical protein
VTESVVLKMEWSNPQGKAVLLKTKSRIVCGGALSIGKFGSMKSLTTHQPEQR